MEKGKITVILNVYNRPYTLEKQLESIKNQTVKIADEDIWIWYNKGNGPQPQPKNPAHRTFVCNQNTKFHGRFAAAMLAKTEYIAMFDDDIFPGHKWLENCMNHAHYGILGGSGVSIHTRNYQPHIKHGWNGNIKPNSIVRVDLVGHAWFFKKEWLKYMWMEEPVSWDNGEDIMFSFLCQKHGNINTFVPPHPMNDRSVWSNIDNGAVGSDAMATFKTVPNHYQLRDHICSECVARGWKTVAGVK